MSNPESIRLAMAVLPIIIAPDPRLKVKCRPVERVDAQIRRLMDNMLETMYLAPGIGLAAPQIGVNSRIIVVDAAREGEDRQPMRLANPEIVWASPETIACEEGCLSLPNQYADVTRPAEARIRFIDHDNEIREIQVKGLLSTCIQHEMDHLDGVLFVDHLSNLRRDVILRKLVKARKTQTTVGA